MIETTLKEYAETHKQIETMQAANRERLATIQEYVEIGGSVEVAGVRAYMKAGRKSTDHEAAYKSTVLAAETAEYVMALEAIRLAHTTVKESVAWAKVTKEAGCDTSAFTTEGKPEFAIEVSK